MCLQESSRWWQWFTKILVLLGGALFSSVYNQLLWQWACMAAHSMDVMPVAGFHDLAVCFRAIVLLLAS